MDRHFFILFGQHAICLIFALMYSPFWGQTVATYGYTVLGGLLVGLWNCKFRRVSYVVLGCMGLVNLFLLNSGFFKLAQYSWDPVNVDCYVYLNNDPAISGDT